jgi:hypothetical protein
MVNIAKKTYQRHQWGCFLPCVSVAVPPHLEDKQDAFLTANKVVSLGQMVMGTSPFIMPVCNAYFVTPKFARGLMEWTNKVKFPWNVQLSYALHMSKTKGCNRDIDVVATRSVMLLDGSKTGHFLSTLNGDNALSMCPEYVEMMKVLSMPKCDKKNKSEEVLAIIQRFESKSEDVVRDHPDMLRLYAESLEKNGNTVKAHEVLGRAVTVLLKNPLVLINNNSTVMKRYLKSFAYVQPD